MKRLAIFVALGLSLGSLTGCALPLAVTLASSIVQIAITASTGKGVTDHILSAATMQDCVLFRVVQGEDVCIDNPNEAVQMRPDGVYMRVTNADGSQEIAKVTKIQPVQAYEDMPRDTNAASVIDAIRGPAPKTGPSGMINDIAGDLPVVQ